MTDEYKEAEPGTYALWRKCIITDWYNGEPKIGDPLLIDGWLGRITKMEKATNYSPTAWWFELERVEKE